MLPFGSTGLTLHLPKDILSMVLRNNNIRIRSVNSYLYQNTALRYLIIYALSGSLPRSTMAYISQYTSGLCLIEDER